MLIDEQRRAAAVAVAMQALPDRQRAAIVLTYYEGVSNAEAAAALGIGVKALESLLVRARQGLSRNPRRARAAAGRERGMSDLNRLLDSYAPPPLPAGLAARASAAAIAAPQDRRGPFARWTRGARRGGWRRGAMIGSAALGLAFTSAVAAEVASGGRIEIPVVHQVVQAIPVFKSEPAKPKPVQLAARTVKAAPKPPEAPAAVKSAPPATRRDRLIEQFAEAKQQVAERRAAGLPTPTADRIERKAKRIVERRAAAGLPVPALDEVELRVALREWRTMRILRQVARDPANLTDVQVQRFARILPPQKRAQFLALGARAAAPADGPRGGAVPRPAHAAAATARGGRRAAAGGDRRAAERRVGHADALRPARGRPPLPCSEEGDNHDQVSAGRHCSRADCAGGRGRSGDQDHHRRHAEI